MALNISLGNLIYPNYSIIFVLILLTGNPFLVSGETRIVSRFLKEYRFMLLKSAGVLIT